MDLFDLSAKITLDTNNYESGISNVQKQTSGFADKLKTGLATAGKVAAAGIGAASTAIIGLGKIGLEYNQQMETYTTNFKVMLGDEEKAVQKVDELKKFAASTPLAMDDLAKGTQTLLAFGVANEDTTSTLKQLGDISLGNADKMQSLATAFGKASAQGKLTGENVQMMIDAGWNPLIQISKDAGETMEETQKRMSAGKVTVDELKNAMQEVTTGTGQFAGGMEQASHTTTGLMSTLQDNAKALVGEVFQPISDGLLGNLLPGAIDAIAQLSESFKENGINGLITAVGDIVGSAIGKFTKMMPDFVQVAVDIIHSIVTGITENLPAIVEGAIQTVEALADGIIDMLPDIIKLGMTLIVTLANSLISHLPDLIVKIPEIVMAIVDGFSENMPNIIEIGKNIVKGVWEGIKSLAGWIKDNISDFFSGIVDGVKNMLGIHSPSKVFAGIGSYMAQGLGVGFDDEFKSVKDDINSQLNFGTASVDFGASAQGIASSGIVNGLASAQQTTGGTLNVNLVMPDGTKIASYLLNPLIQAARQNGTPIANPVV